MFMLRFILQIIEFYLFEFGECTLIPVEPNSNMTPNRPYWILYNMKMKKVICSMQFYWALFIFCDFSGICDCNFNRKMRLILLHDSLSLPHFPYNIDGCLRYTEQTHVFSASLIIDNNKMWKLCGCKYAYKYGARIIIIYVSFILFTMTFVPVKLGVKRESVVSVSPK